MGKFGGAQPGAGRPKGAKSKRTQELIARATADGVTPLEVLVGDMRFYYNLANDRMSEVGMVDDVKRKARLFRVADTLKGKARECAIAAAPYIHPKLASIQAKLDVQVHESRLAKFKDLGI